MRNPIVIITQYETFACHPNYNHGDVKRHCTYWEAIVIVGKQKFYAVSYSPEIARNKAIEKWLLS